MPSPSSAALRTALRVALTAYGVALAAVLLWPSTGTNDRVITATAELAADLGLPPALADPVVTEVLLNVVAFVPLTLLAALLWPRPRWAAWTVGVLLASLLVEVVQATVLGAQTGAASDVVANTLGALVGALLARLVGHRRGPVGPGRD